MSDVRKCDGPNCDKEAPLERPDFIPFELKDVPAEHYIILECTTRGRFYHFHNQKCLSDWTKETTRADRHENAG